MPFQCYDVNHAKSYLIFDEINVLVHHTKPSVKHSIKHTVWKCLKLLFWKNCVKSNNLELHREPELFSRNIYWMRIVFSLFHTLQRDLSKYITASNIELRKCIWKLQHISISSFSTYSKALFLFNFINCKMKGFFSWDGIWIMEKLI